jgi:hypothetical protein
LTQRNSLPSGRDPDYQAFVSEQRKARRLLARMDRMEDFARESEQFTQIYTDLPERDVEWHRQHHANTYRRLVGVMPDQRGALRRELQDLIETGHRSVDAVIASVRNRTVDIIDAGNPETPFA